MSLPPKPDHPQVPLSQAAPGETSGRRNQFGAQPYPSAAPSGTALSRPEQGRGVRLAPGTLRAGLAGDTLGWSLPCHRSRPLAALELPLHPQSPPCRAPCTLQHVAGWHKQRGTGPAATEPWPCEKLSTATLHPRVWVSPPSGGRWPEPHSPSPGSLPLGKGAARLGGGISLARFPCIVPAWVIEEIFQVLLLPSGHGGSPAPFPPLSAARPDPRSAPRPLKIALCQAIVPTPSWRH